MGQSSLRLAAARRNSLYDMTTASVEAALARLLSDCVGAAEYVRGSVSVGLRCSRSKYDGKVLDNGSFSTNSLRCCGDF